MDGVGWSSGLLLAVLDCVEFVFTVYMRCLAGR